MKKKRLPALAIEREVMKCEDCKWWEGDIALVNSKGFCHRYPPPHSRGEGETGDDSDYFPYVKSDDWCGEFQPTVLDIYNKPIESLLLSDRPINCLHDDGIITIGDLVGCDKVRLLSIRGFGMTSFREVRRKLLDNDLFLMGDAEKLKKRKKEDEEAEAQAEATVREVLGMG